MKISDEAIDAACKAYNSTDYFGMKRILEAACPIVMKESTLAKASQDLLLAYANTAIHPEHKPAWKALIEALKAVRPFLEEK